MSIQNRFEYLLFNKQKHRIPLDIKKYIFYISNRNIVANKATLKNADNNVTLVYNDTTKGIEKAVLISNVANFFAPISTQYI